MRWLCVVSGVEKHCLIVMKSEDGKFSASHGRKINFDRKQEKYLMFIYISDCINISFGDYSNSNE